MYPKKGEKKPTPTQFLLTYNEGEEEKIEEIQEIVKVTKRHFKKGEFFMQAFTLNALVMERDYKLLDLKVLFTLESWLDYNNRIQSFRQIDVAEEIGSSQSNVSKSINKLLKDGIIYRDGVDYYFSDEYIKYAGDNTPRRPRGRPRKSNKPVLVYPSVNKTKTTK